LADVGTGPDLHAVPWAGGGSGSNRGVNGCVGGDSGFADAESEFDVFVVERGGCSSVPKVSVELVVAFVVLVVSVKLQDIWDQIDLDGVFSGGTVTSASSEDNDGGNSSCKRLEHS